MIYNFSLKDGNQSSVVTGLRFKSAFWYVYQGRVENVYAKEIQTKEKGPRLTKRRKYRKNNISTCARSSCCFPACTTWTYCETNTEQSAPSESHLNTCNNTETEGVVNQVYAPEKNSVVHKNKVPRPTSSKKSNKKFDSCDYFNDPLYIRFQQYKLLRKRTK